MRFMMIIKADKNSEAGVMPSEPAIIAMNRYNEELIKAGVMLAGEGLHPSSKGARILFSQGKRTVVDGPFTEAKELIAGFWIIQVKSKEEAIEWAKRVPFETAGTGQPGSTGEIELRQIFDSADFAPILTSDEGRAVLAAEQAFRERTNTLITAANANPGSEPNA